MTPTTNVVVASWRQANQHQSRSRNKRRQHHYLEVATVKLARRNFGLPKAESWNSKVGRRQN